MRRYIGSLWVSVVCAVVLSGAPGVAVADEVNPSSASSVTTTGPMAMIAPALTTSEMSSRDELAISVSPTAGSPGTAVLVRGTGWTHQVYADGVEVEISQNYGNGQLTRLTSARSGPPDANGAFSLRMTIPATAKPGLLSISPITGGPEISDALFTVTGGGAPSGQVHAQPTVTLIPSEGPPGTVTTADGHGFIPNQSVKVTQSGGPGVTGGGGTIQADQSGATKMSFRIADQTPPGVITVTFAQGPMIATAQFRVTSASTGPTFASGDQLKDLLVKCVLPVIPVVGGPAQFVEEYRALLDQGRYQEALQKLAKDLDPNLKKLVADYVEQGQACRALSREVGLTGPYGIIPTP